MVVRGICNSLSISAWEMFLLSTIISPFSISIKQCRWHTGGMVMSNHGGLFTRRWNLDDKLCKVPLFWKLLTLLPPRRRRHISEFGLPPYFKPTNTIVPTIKPSNRIARKKTAILYIYTFMYIQYRYWYSHSHSHSHWHWHWHWHRGWNPSTPNFRRRIH